MWNIKDKLCLITGATSGIGFQTALELGRRGARVAITYRNPQKAEDTSKLFATETGHDLESYFCELSSFESIRSFANEFKTRHQQLDVLINNAGIWESDRKLSTDGIELNFATNHLGPFLLTNLLLEILSDGARIINVSSGVHSQARINFDDIELQKNYSGYQAYGQSKLANILFTKLLAEKLRDKNITVNSLHPGVVHTNIFHTMGKVGVTMMRPIMISPKKGAMTSIYLATSDEVSNITGEYFTKEKLVNSSAASCDMDAARRLWNLSEKYVGM